MSKRIRSFAKQQRENARAAKLAEKLERREARRLARKERKRGKPNDNKNAVVENYQIAVPGMYGQHGSTEGQS
jgi:hypothetical protein